MKIQEGIVRYKDRTDIVCLYGITDDGKQYYFLDETDTKKLANGNRIVSTALVEAIDPMYKASNIGVIDEDGVEKIPCINRSIELVQGHDDILLVELANPVTESVIEANQLRNDPLSAAKLVSTPSVIKEKINNQMGPEGRYAFHDQFSEATIFDIDGNNLVNGELYSFIGYANDQLYMAKNTVDTDVTVFSLSKEAVNEVAPVEENIEVAVANPIEDEVVETPVEEVAQDVNPIEVPVEEVTNIGGFASDNMFAPPVETEPLGKEITIPTIDEDKEEEIKSEPIVEEDKEVSFNTEFFPQEEPVNEINFEETEEIKDEVKEPEETALDDLFFETSKEPKLDTFSEITADKIVDEEDEFDNPIEEEPVKESIMEDVAKTMAGLIKQNKELKAALNEANERNEKLVSSRKNAADRAKMLEQKNDALVAKNHGLESKITKLESSNEILTARTRDQEKLIDIQKRDLDLLKYQLEGQEDAIKTLADAKVLLGTDDEYQENDYRKVA